MTEILKTDAKDVKPQTPENYRKIQPEKELSIKELNQAVKDEFCKAAEEMKNFDGETNLDPSHKDCLTTSKERKEFASKGSEGQWDDEPGNSVFHPEKAEAQEALKKYDQDGIKYTDGEPDFSNVSEITVEISDMTSIRPNNFKQASEICAEQWNGIAKDNRTDWTASKVDEWRAENRYSWHERLDRKTMDLVQRDIHEECKHFGGVSECKRRESITGGEFDD